MAKQWQPLTEEVVLQDKNQTDEWLHFLRENVVFGNKDTGAWFVLPDDIRLCRLVEVKKSDPYVRAGLLNGRVRMGGWIESSTLRPAFHAALQMATKADLMWALELLIKHPQSKRTWRDYRIQQIDKRLRELVQALAQEEAQQP